MREKGGSRTTLWDEKTQRSRTSRVTTRLSPSAVKKRSCRSGETTPSSSEAG